ncbi:FG-GAP repeat domain-containing protein [Yinghuangia aomiensis]
MPDRSRETGQHCAQYDRWFWIRVPKCDSWRSPVWNRWTPWQQIWILRPHPPQPRRDQTPDPPPHRASHYKRRGRHSPPHDNGTISTPAKSWNVVGAGWSRPSIQLNAGDVNGDGRADIAMMYAYLNDRMALYTLTSKPDGGFNAPLLSTDIPAGNWNANNSKALMGDVNADGRADIYTIDDYRTTRWAAFTFKGQPHRRLRQRQHELVRAMGRLVTNR